MADHIIKKSTVGLTEQKLIKKINVSLSYGIDETQTICSKEIAKYEFVVKISIIVFGTEFQFHKSNCSAFNHKFINLFINLRRLNGYLGITKTLTFKRTFCNCFNISNRNSLTFRSYIKKKLNALIENVRNKRYSGINLDWKTKKIYYSYVFVYIGSGWSAISKNSHRA